MDFAIEKKKHAQSYDKDVLDVSYEFSKLAYKEFQPILKGIILFGSSARKVNSTSSDIDILVVLDDVTVQLTHELVETFRVISAKLVQKVSKRLHITTLKYSTFFEYVRIGDPIGLNILRDGVALVDTGFFDPLQALLLQGRIRPSFESVWTYHNRASQTLFASRNHLLRATEDLYWAVTDSAHAALMKLGVVAATPDQLSALIDQKMVQTKLIDKRYAKIASEFYSLYKQITHKNLKDITGTNYEHYYNQAKDFVTAMHRFLIK